MSSITRIYAAAALIVAVSAPMACASGASGASVTVASPAYIAVERSDRTGTGPGGRDYVEIAVRGFRPSAEGPVQFVVELPGERATEIGRFGLFPERAFSADDPSQTQRFSFPVDPALRADAVRRLRIRLIPSAGDGRAASADVTARLARHD